MKASVVELVFVIDTSESMRPCLEGLARNLDQIVQPLQGFNWKVRFGLVALSMGKADGGAMAVRGVTLAGDVGVIYQESSALFTEDAAGFAAKVRGLELGGDENHLIALDCAFDFPFGPLDKTRRVVALFSDERIEDGMLGPIPIEGSIEKLAEKATARRIMLFAALPSSPALDQLGGIPCSQIEPVTGGDGLASVNFSKLLEQMGKSISVSSLQGHEGTYERGIFGQQQWSRGTGSFDGLR
jgi:hypothetical protein